MSFLYRRRPIFALLAFGLLSAPLACGGGGGGNGSMPTPDPSASPSASPSPSPSPVPTGRAFFELSWGARSRASASAPSSARSARVTFSGTGGSGSVTVDRNANPAAYTQRYENTQPLPVGPYTATIQFFADPGASGPVVGFGSAAFTLASDGSGLGAVATTGTVRSVEVVPGQLVAYGAKRDLGLTVRDPFGVLLALSPGSAFGTVTAGSERLKLANGIEAEGTRPGAAQVQVSVDGIASAPATVTVTSETIVQALPTRIEVGAGKSTTFTANLVGAAEPGVIWSAPSGGSIDAGGTFTAPNAVGEFPVIATSQWDASKSAQAVAVVVPTVSISPGGPVVTTLRKQTAFTATVLGPANTGVTWSVTEPGGGTITSVGLYTAPAIPGTYTVVATSVADPRQKASVTVRVQSGSGGIQIQ